MSERVEIPREIVTEVLEYFGSYEDDRHRELELGVRDIRVYRIMSNRLIKKINSTRKKDKYAIEEDKYINELMEYMRILFDKTKKRYNFGYEDYVDIRKKLPLLQEIYVQGYNERDKNIEHLGEYFFSTEPSDNKHNYKNEYEEDIGFMVWVYKCKDK